MRYKDLRDFIAQLEQQGELKRIAAEVDPHLEMTEICDRVLRAGGPAILFEKPEGPLAFRCWPTCSARRGASRWAWARNRWRRCAKSASCWPILKEPEPPKGLKDAWDKLPVLQAGAQHGAEGAVAARPARRSCGKARTSICRRLPIQTCWPGDAAPLITWGLTVTRGPHKKRGRTSASTASR